MPELATDCVVESLVEAMETMAFISPFPADSQQCPERAMVVSIPFEGRCRGHFHLMTSRDLGTLLAMNILEVDPASPDAPQKGLDALRELANITCGAWLRRAAGGEAGSFSMTVPTCRDLDSADQWAAMLEGGVCVLDADGVPVAAVVIEE